MFAVFPRLKVLHLFLAVVLMLQGTAAGFASVQDGQGTIENVHFEVAGDIVRIDYDLNAPIDKIHGVRVVLYRESDPSFSYRPVNITGDVGTIVFSGQKRRIVWEFTKEFPDGLNGTDYYFVVEAEGMEQESSNTWWYVGGGAVAVTGLVVVLLLSPKTVDPPPVTPVGFPTPPTRPN